MTDRLSGIVDAVRVRVEDELRQQLSALTSEHERALDEALREAAQAAEQQARAADVRWSGLMAEARAEAEQKVASAVADARAADEAARLDDRSSEDIARTRVSQELERAETLSGVLDVLGGMAAREAGGAVFVVKRGSLDRWTPSGDVPGPVSSDWVIAAESAARGREPERRGDLLAVPVLLDRTAVAVVVGHEPRGHRGIVEQMATAGATRLAAVTATRLIQADRWIGGASSTDAWRAKGPADFPSEGL